MRTPAENGLRSIAAPAARTASNVSRAECPHASTTRRAGMRLTADAGGFPSGASPAGAGGSLSGTSPADAGSSPAGASPALRAPSVRGTCAAPLSRTSTAASTPSSKCSPTSCAWKRTSPPAATMRRRRARTTSTSLSVPMCGFACQRISRGAPASANASSTWRMWGLFVPVVSLPSENVPAPPSPNWMFVRASSGPPASNAATAAKRSSTSPPRSSTRGRNPASAR